MKVAMKIGFGIATAAVLLLSGCNSEAAPAQAKSVVKPAIDATQLGYRGTTLDSNVETPKVEYSKADAGSSKRIARAFQDAPPMIPHKVDGMLPITKNNNQCITCHVDSAPYDKSIPSVPPSHFTNFRPSSSYALKGVNTSDMGDLKHVHIKKQKTLYEGRFNCTQCHAPQANVKPLVGNTFVPEYKKVDAKFKSYWNDSEYLKDIGIKE